MIIDGHAHAAREFSNISSLLKELEQAKVDKVVLCPSLKNHINIPNPPAFFKGKQERGVKKLYAGNAIITFLCRILKQKGDSNEFVHQIVKQAPEKIIQFYWVDFNSATVLQDLPNAIEKYPSRGLKIHQAWTPFDCNSEQFKKVLEFSGIHSLPIFIHPSSEMELKKLKHLAYSYPSAQLIISHLMGLHIFHDYTGDNVYHDISPEDLLTENIYRSIEIFGSDKIIFGSDMPFGNLKENISKIEALNISDRDKSRILGGNIQQLLNVV